MGIAGLLPLLKSIHKPVTLKKFAGQTIGIDAYGWLHRGTVACAIELATGKPTTKYVDFAMSRVRMLLDFGVTPYLVFDGDAIPSKAGTNAERRKKREESLAAGLELYRAGRVSQAHQELQKAAGVTPIMARQFIDELRRNNIQYVVAPYEADAQLAYLEQKGIINGVLSEDSDLLVFGVKRLLTKLNQYGECIEVERADFANCKELSLAGWTDTMFRRMAILSGCDYLTNIPKMGLKTSYRYVRKFKDTERLLRMVALEGFLVPIGYLELFNNAELTFMHHRVFCPLQQRLVFLNELAPGTREEDMPFLGANVESDIAIGVACGDLNPKTKEPLHVRTTNTTSRPPLKESRRQTLAAPSDLKSSKSIDNFFKKPCRQPLAELDVNSLTPLKSQQRRYEAHRNASWEPRMVSSAPQLRRADTALTNARTPTHSSDRRAWLAKAGQISTYQPPKRQRLCSEFEISPDKEVEQSPFFISKSQIDEPSPLARSKVSKKKTKKGGFDVFSDDEISEEAWLELAKVQELASPEGIVHYSKIAVEEDSIGRGPSQEGDSPQTILQSSPIRPNIGEAVTPGPTKSFDTVITNDEDATQGSISVLGDGDGVEQFEDLLEYHIREQNKKLRESFVCQSSERRQLALESVTSPKVHISPKRGHSPSSTFVAQSPEKQTIALKKSLSAPHNAQEDENPQSLSIKLIPNFAYQSPTYQTATLQSSGRVQSHTDKIEVAKAAITQKTAGMATPPAVRAPTSSLQRIGRNALDRKSLVAHKAPAPVHKTEDRDFGNIIAGGEDRPQHHETWASKGSEDFIVPESDEEEYVDAPEEMEKCRRINLAAFTFTGQ